MKQKIALKHEFVEFIPEVLKEGTVYISIRFATVSHLCVCGCKNKVVTPLRPMDWKLIFDGKTVSLYPSIGNWSFPCRSHYWIRNSRVQWATRWSQKEIDAGRAYDHHGKERYFGLAEAEEEHTPEKAAPPKKRLWRKFRKWWSN